MTAFTDATARVIELAPNSGAKEFIIKTYNTADQTNTIVVPLADIVCVGTGPAASYLTQEVHSGIQNPGPNGTANQVNGFCIIDSWVHTTGDGNIIVSDTDTTTIDTAGVLTITIVNATNDDTRVCHIIGISRPLVLASVM